MSSILDYIASLGPATILPILIAIALFLFKKIASLSIEKNTAIEYPEGIESGKPSVSENIKVLIAREDVSLRVLEEIYQTNRSRRFFFSQNGDSKRAIDLRKIQEILRDVLNDSIKSNDFATIRDKIIKLIDDAQIEIDLLQQRKPFDGLQEPEKSLLVDLLAELPDVKPIQRQKVLQLADIIKLKHQDMLKLQQENAKSAAWTRWGTYGTIFFGILSIVLSIYTAVK